MSDVQEVNPIVTKETTEKRTRGDNQISKARVSLSWVPLFKGDRMSSDSDSDESMEEDSDLDEDEYEPSTSKKLKSKGRGRRSKVSVEKSEGVGHDQVILAPESTGEDSDEAEYKPSSSKQLKSIQFGGGRGRRSKKPVEKSDGVVQDQIILAPEIMCLILEQLDFRSLKQVRLVCKSWLLEAQTHMKKRAIVRFERDGCTARITSFLKTLRTKLPTLPNPFESIDLDFHTYIRNLGYKGLVGKVGRLRPPLVITRFNPAAVPMKVALPLILQYSSSLEYLKLVAVSCEADYLPPMDPEQNFPKLRHIHAELTFERTDQFPLGIPNTDVDWKHFPSIVAWIVKASPTLEVFESTNVSENELANELSWRIDITNVKSLTLWHYRYNTRAPENFLSIPFSRLENLKIVINSYTPSRVNEAVVAALKNSAHTLKTLNLHQEKKQLLVSFPLCPDVYELSLSVLQNSNAFISNPFPSLQILNLKEFDVDVLGDSWRKLPPFLGLKTLRVRSCELAERDDDDDDELPMKFFEKFPSLDRLQLDSEFLLRCCQLKATGESRFATLLEGVRHLEIAEKYMLREGDENRDYSVLRFLKGIEVLTIIKATETVVLIPFREMPALKVLEFPWVDSRNFHQYYQLPELTRGLEQVFVTNCCSVRRGSNHRLKYRLDCFFDSATNAECGCGRSLKKLL